MIIDRFKDLGVYRRADVEFGGIYFVVFIHRQQLVVSRWIDDDWEDLHRQRCSTPITEPELRALLENVLGPIVLEARL